MRRLALLLILLLSLSLNGRAQTDRVDALMAQLSLKQRVAQLFLVGIYGNPLNAPSRDFLREWQPGGAVLFVSNVGTPQSVTALTNSWQQTILDAGGVPLFIATDQEGGQIARLKDGFTTWPVPMLLTASGDLDIAQRVGTAMASELRAVGINMNLAPVADLYTNLRNPIIGRRSFGSDPTLTGRMLAATVRGLQAGGVMATAKHFPGHGDTDSDSHTSLPVVSHPRDSLERIELEPFRWTISAGVESIMVAHIWYPAFDPQGETPASLSSEIVTGLLRGDMGFQGLIMTDAIEMDAIDTRFSYGEASIRAIQAGVDIVAFGAHLSPNAQAAAMQAVLDAVNAGTLTESRIDESVRRVLSAKARYGVLDWQPLDVDSAVSRINSLGHAELVDELFHAGVTVAYDNAGMIPVSTGSSVAVIYPGTRPAIRAACEPLHPNIRWVTVGDTPTQEHISAAVYAASVTDRAIVFTQNAEIISAQQALVNALPADKTIAVALFSPYDWQAFPDVGAYVTTYSPLEPAVPAACDVLFGASPARGELPVALDGVRDYADSVLAVERTALPTARPESLMVAANFTPATIAPQETALPTLTPSATPTRAPLEAASRTPEPVINSTAVAALPPTSVFTPPDAAAPVQDSATPPYWAQAALLVGLIGAPLTGYAALYWRGAASQGRYKRGFVIDQCPVCGQEALRVKVKRERAFGIPRAKHAVLCESCGSTLREVGAGRWRYRVNEAVNPALHARWNNKVIDSAALRQLSQRLKAR